MIEKNTEFRFSFDVSVVDPLTRREAESLAQAMAVLLDVGARHTATVTTAPEPVEVTA